MTVKEAYALLLSRINNDNLKAVKCYEYESRFVFVMAPNSYDVNNKDIKKIMFDSSFAVIKATKEVRDFKPFHVTMSEHESKKEIIDFMM